MSDYAAFLSNIKGRNVPWVGHADFPRKVVQTFRRGDHYWHKELRIFELDWTEGNQPMYHLMSEAEIQEYLNG